MLGLFQTASLFFSPFLCPKILQVGLSSRGQRALQKLDAWKDVAPYCSAVVGRKDWSPQTSRKDAVNAADSPTAAGGGKEVGSALGGGQGQGVFPPPLSESGGDDEWGSADQDDAIVPLSDPGGGLNVYVDRPYVTQVVFFLLMIAGRIL